jgi:anti-sigma-K factor RskA
MHPRSEELAALHVLGLLRGRDALRFRRELAADPELRRLVRELEAGLAGYAAANLPPTAPPENVWRRIHARLDEPVASQPAATSEPAWTWQRWAWPAAALLLLGWNLWLLTAPVRQPPQPPAAVATAPDAWAAQDAMAAGETEPFADPQFAGYPELVQRVDRLVRELEARDALLASRGQAVTQLQEWLRDLEADNDEIERAYNQIVGRFLPFYEETPGLGRFTVIELVDQQSYIENAPRRGIAELAHRALTGGHPLAGTGSQTTGPDLGESAEAGSGLAAIPRNPDLLFGAGFNVGAALPTGAGAPAPPLAFTVWSDQDQKGFIDLYNLPNPGEGRVMQLWMRAGQADPYVSVGLIPAMQDGSGSLFYAVGQEAFTPVEVILTIEPDGGSTQPVGEIILRGP